MKSVETCTVLKSMLKPVSRSNSDTFPFLCQLRRVLRSLIHTTEVGQKRKAIYNVTTVTENPSFDNSFTNLNSSLKRFLIGTFLFYYLGISIVGRISNLKWNKPLENIYFILQYTFSAYFAPCIWNSPSCDQSTVSLGLIMKGTMATPESIAGCKKI